MYSLTWPTPLKSRSTPVVEFPSIPEEPALCAYLPLIELNDMNLKPPVSVKCCEL